MMNEKVLSTAIEIFDTLHKRKSDLLDEIQTANIELAQLNSVIAQMSYELYNAGIDIRWRYCDKKAWTGQLIRIDGRDENKN